MQGGEEEGQDNDAVDGGGQQTAEEEVAHERAATRRRRVRPVVDEDAAARRRCSAIGMRAAVGSVIRAHNMGRRSAAQLGGDRIQEHDEWPGSHREGVQVVVGRCWQLRREGGRVGEWESGRGDSVQAVRCTGTRKKGDP